MTKKIEEDRSDSAFPPAPIFFADQPAALMLGPHVSRVSFGVVEMDDSQYPRSVVTIAMPTVALLQFVNEAKTALDSASFKKDTIAQLEQAIKAIAAGDVSTVARHVAETKPAGKVRARRLK